MYERANEIHRNRDDGGGRGAGVEVGIGQEKGKVQI